MVKQQQSFLRESRHEAASLVLNQGYSISEASKSLGVGTNDARLWVTQLGQERQGVMPKSKALMNRPGFRGGCLV
jgi:transposase